jgi:uncharacterized membrane protein
MLNHFPIVGMTFAIPLLLLGWGTKSEDLIRVGLGLVSLTGLLAVATFLTGEPAEEVVEHLPGIAKRLITIHEEAAEKSIWMVSITAVAALISLIIGFKRKTTPKAAVLLVTCLSVACVGVLAWTNNLGGQISHDELRSTRGVLVPLAWAPLMPAQRKSGCATPTGTHATCCTSACRARSASSAAGVVTRT